jgi:hypothetical protein
MTERFDDIIREFIDFANRQVGVYMDSMAGFANIKVKIERQVHRVNHPTGRAMGEKGEPVIVWSSYEDPSQPDIIHSRIVRADDYVAANSPGGSNEQQQSHAILVFLYTYWEESIRQRLAKAKAVEKNDIKSEIMADLKIVRHAILHAKAKISRKEFGRVKRLNNIFKPETEINVSYDDMHKIFYMVKQDIARLLFDWLGVQDAPISLDQLRDIAIQRSRRD